MDISGDDADVFRCNSCGNVGIGRGEIDCCDGPMELVDADGDGVGDPSLDELLRTVFDMSETELDICLCVMEGGDQTVKELAELTDYDRSVVARHLDHLGDLGVVERQRRLLRQGGHVYVYTPTDEATVRRNLEQQFLQWLQTALVQLESLQREKVEGIVEANVEGEAETDAGGETEAQWKVYRDG